MKNKLVSVIVPIYNSELYLDKCIVSIINQSYKNLELLLINDGSKDSSLDICKKYAAVDERIHIINKKNEGVSIARNTGIKKAKGDYLLFVDSDDFLNLSHIEYLLFELKKDVFQVCKKKKFKRESYSNNIKEKIEKDFIFEISIVDLIRYKALNQPFGRLYDSRIVKENGLLFDNSLCLGEDLLFNISYLKKLRKPIIKYINKELYYYRIDNSFSLSKKYYPNMLEIQIRLLNEVSNYLDEQVSAPLDSYYLQYILTIISNEYHNKEESFWSRNKKAKKLLGDEVIIAYIEKYKQSLSKIEYHLLKRKHYLAFITLKKVKLKMLKKFF